MTTTRRCRSKGKTGGGDSHAPGTSTSAGAGNQSSLALRPASAAPAVSSTSSASAAATASSTSTSSASSLVSLPVVASQKTAGPPNVLRFQRPHSSLLEEEDPRSEEQFIFPPTIFTDATYTRGIMVANNDNNGQQQYKKRRVAKDCDGTIYLGTVTDYKDDGGRRRWHITYDDGDEEDFNRSELTGAIALYEEHEGKQDGEDANGGSSGGNIDIDQVEMEIPYDYFGPDHHNVKCRDLPYDYGGCMTDAKNNTSHCGPRLLPVLSQDEAIMWTQKKAAHAASNRRFPMQANRLLGTITLYFDECLLDETRKGDKKGRRSITLDDVGLLAQSRQACDKYRSRYVSRSGIPRRPNRTHDKINMTISPKQAMAEAMAEESIEEGTDPAFLPSTVRTKLETRSQQITQSWRRVKGTRPLRECWDEVDGGFVREALGESLGGGDADVERHIPVSVLLEWISNGASGVVVTDLSQGADSISVQWSPPHPDRWSLCIGRLVGPQLP